MERREHASQRSVPAAATGRTQAPARSSPTATPVGHRVTLRDRDRISYVDVGPVTGRPIIYLHGTPSCRLEAAALADTAGELALRVLAPDRPGYGGTTFSRYRVRDYPRIVARFADALGIAEFGVIGVSGGGRYACACAAELGSRVTRLALVASTAPPELSGVRDTWNRQDRLLYTLADKAPPLLRLVLAGFARGIRDEPERVRRLFSDLPAVDEAVLGRPDVNEAFGTMLREAFRRGGRASSHDLTLEARAWDIDLGAIEAPVDVWHGADDTIVSVQQAEFLVHAIPHARSHILAGEGHVSLVVDQMRAVLEPFC